MEIKVIESSSRGNCYLLKTSGETLLIECGVQYKKILNGLGYKLNNVAGCLITHEHGDHSKSVKDVMKAGINVYTAQGTINKLGLTGHRVNAVKALEQFTIGNFTVLPFDVQHDAAEPLGYLIQHPEIGKLLFATDTYYIKYKFSGLNYALLECNYDSRILSQNLSSGAINWTLKNRIIKSHFSLENVKGFLSANDKSQLKQIYLMHLSDRNSDAKLFKSEIEKLTGIPVVVC